MNRGDCVKFRAVVTNISIVDSPWGERMVKIDLTEDRETPSTVVMSANQSELAREIAPVIAQIFKSMPLFGMSGKTRLPRLSIYLTEEEWDRLIEKPTIGDLMEVEVSKGYVKLRKV